MCILEYDFFDLLFKFFKFRCLFYLYKVPLEHVAAIGQSIALQALNSLSKDQLIGCIRDSGYIKPSDVFDKQRYREFKSSVDLPTIRFKKIKTITNLSFNGNYLSSIDVRREFRNFKIGFQWKNIPYTFSIIIGINIF